VNNNVVTDMNPGNYTIQVTDSNGCTETVDVVIETPSELTVVVDGSTAPTCAGGMDGLINVTVSRGTTPYSYSWSNGSSIEDLVNLPAGTYDLTVTDANDCQVVSAPVTLTDPTAAVITINNIEDTECNAAVGSVEIESDTDGTITVDGSSQAVTAATPVTFTDLAAGFYTATFEDANGCQVEESFNINNSN
jgi:hypothetical protein